MQKVVILQHRLLHYRMAFFNRLRIACEEHGIRLYLVHGQPTNREEKKLDVGVLPWADVVTNQYVSFYNKDILWQPFPKKHRDADLIVVMQENRLLSNYTWLFLRGLHKSKVGYWGHGRNFQAPRPNSLFEKWKQFLVGRVDWWFAYTEMTRDILLSNSYPNERITVLNNTIDNEGFRDDLASITNTGLTELRSKLRLKEGSYVGLFCGSLYPDKRIDFMVAAADKIKAALPNFHMLVIGDGPCAAEISKAAEARHWLHWLGVRKGMEKAAYFCLAHVIVNPGLVGLHILESFCAGVPMVTSTDARHSPEIEYLKDGENGMLVKGDLDDYAGTIIRLLKTQKLHGKLKSGALDSARRYTLQNMVERFVDGIENCLMLERKF